jgi:hypothetical protein
MPGVSDLHARPPGLCVACSPRLLLHPWGFATASSADAAANEEKKPIGGAGGSGGSNPLPSLDGPLERGDSLPLPSPLKPMPRGSPANKPWRPEKFTCSDSLGHW